MKNVSALKSNNTESPKTPGGISKSLLTPCRRLGLSRKWKKAGPSPFVSPLSRCNSNSVEIKVEKKETRKRKERIADEETEEISRETPQNSVENDGVLDIDLPLQSEEKNYGIVDTPSRSVTIPRKKSKTLSSISKENAIDQESKLLGTKQTSCVPTGKDLENNNKDENEIQAIDAVTPVRTKSIIKNKKSNSPLQTISKVAETDYKTDFTEIEIKENINNATKEIQNNEVKTKSPNELTKECIVVIQKKIFKTDKKETKAQGQNDSKNCKKSQTLFDSDSDEMPLAQLNKKENIDNLKINPEIITIDEDDDFTECKMVKVKNLEEKHTSTTSLKSKNKSTKNLKAQKPIKIKESKPEVSNSFDDDEDFDFEKRTILIRKSYDKVTKPLKAKSTGSITQRDIDELKARIEMKKKMLLAKAMTEDTAELRGLIKKWQKGCQDALMELMELMRNKFLEKQNMDYSEILQLLKIPTNLVGYDTDNDCFNTPDDTNIILAKFNDF